MILDRAGTSVLKVFQLKGVPSHISCYGKYMNEYRVVIACRDGKVSRYTSERTNMHVL